MPPPIPRFVRWTVVLAVIAALSVAVFQYWGSAQYGAADAQGAAVTQTQWGPLGPADRDLLVKVRQAGLWEAPVAQQAQQQAISARVREVGGLISAEHTDLDARVRDVSARLGVLLPNQPSAQQQSWMAEIASQSSSDFDRMFVQRLRAAHGNVLPIISQVRAGTRNELVRQFATTAAQFVTRHHEYLESTGLVDYSALPEAPAPAAAPPAAAAPQAAAVSPVAAVPPALPAAAVPPGVAAPQAPASSPPVAVEPTASGHGRHVAQAFNVTPVSGANVMIAALVYIAALLAIVGLLSLLGTAGLRARRAHPRRAVDRAPRPVDRPARAVTSPRGVVPDRPRHAAHRW